MVSNPCCLCFEAGSCSVSRPSCGYSRVIPHDLYILHIIWWPEPDLYLLLVGKVIFVA